MKHLIELLYAKFLQSTGICTDTRKIASGNLFFALKGPNFNGNQYTEQALEQGASCAVIDDPAFAIKGKTILVDDALTMLQELAKFHRSRLRCPILGITGSNGKTTTKELIRNVLAKKFIVASTKGNLNNHIGVPLTILEINPQTEFAIIEMGASAIGEIAALCVIAQPTMGLITNIGKAHTETFGGIEGVIRGKSELYDYLRKTGGQVFINFIDPVLMNMSKRFEYPQIYPDTDMNLISADPFIIYQSRNGNHQTNLIGSYNFANMAAALSLGRYMQVEEGLIHEAITQYAPDNNRSELSEVAETGNLIIKDAYNANPDSMRAAISNFVEMTGRKVMILGDMNELENPDEEHIDLGKWIADLEIEEVLFCGELMRKAHEVCERSLHFETIEELLSHVNEGNWKQTNFLLKGSRSIRLERLFPILEKS